MKVVFIDLIFFLKKNHKQKRNGHQPGHNFKNHKQKRNGHQPGHNLVVLISESRSNYQVKTNQPRRLTDSKKLSCTKSSI